MVSSAFVSLCISGIPFVHFCMGQNNSISVFPRLVSHAENYHAMLLLNLLPVHVDIDIDNSRQTPRKRTFESEIVRVADFTTPHYQQPSADPWA